MATILISDKNKDYDKFMTETVDKLREFEVKGIVIAVILKDGEVFTGYHNMELQDKMIAKEFIGIDIMDDVMRVNYYDEDDAFEYDDEED